jgi:anti-sigma factor RsiW
MHDIVRDNLEDYLRLNGGSQGSVEVERHLSTCAECREAVGYMRETSSVLASLRAPAESDPSPGFYDRVMNRIESERKPSVWSLLLDPIFGKRLVYAALTLVVMLSTYLVSTENSADLTIASAPETILSNQSRTPVLTSDTERDRDVILVNLATYKE